MSSRKGKTIDPEIQRAIVAEYKRGVRGCGKRTLAKKYAIGVNSVMNIVGRAKKRKANPVVPRGHKRRKLSKREEVRVWTHLDKHPGATNEQLAKVVHNKVQPRTISDVLARASPRFSRKKFSDQEPEEFSDEWKEECRGFVRRVKRVPLNKRVYEDETGIFSNDAPEYGRCRKGKKLYRSRKRRGVKYTLHVFARQSKAIYWALRDQNANDAEVCTVMRSASKKLENVDVLLWDRLGRSGRCKNPKAQHYNPKVIQQVKNRGAEVWFLPPKGKYFNPIELLFNDLKNHHIRPAYGRNSKEMTKYQLSRIIGKYMREVAPVRLPGFFKARANGSQARNDGLF